MNILSEINALALNNPEKLILDAEHSYYNEIEKLVNTLKSNPDYKILLLSGPSASGKTTTAHIIKTALCNTGISAEVVSLDNFYLSVDKMPLQENGEPDFESVYSLDIPAIHRCFFDAVKYGKTDIPLFDFQKKKRSENTHKIDISNNGVLIVEGLHALNPVLTDTLNAENVFKVYISVNDFVYDDNGEEVISSRRIRLSRRISRDYIYRGTAALGTLKLWTSVVEGEEKYLYPYKDLADMMFKTFHSFECSVFRNIYFELLKDLPETAPNYEYAISVKDALEKFVPLSADLVPQDSLIREFIPGGLYENVK